MSQQTTIKVALANEGRVTISADASGSAIQWDSAVDFFQRHCPMSIYNGANRTIALDWWDLAGILFELRAFGRIQPLIRFEFDEASAHQIREATANRRYTEAGSAVPLVADEIRARLSAAGFLRELTPEQLRNVGKLAALPHGATYSVPGAGKTTEALSTFVVKRSDTSTPINRLLVVCPKNAFPAWEEQVEACFGKASQWSPVRLVRGYQNIRAILLGSAPPAITLITYQQLASNGVTSLIGSFLSQVPSAMFLDESHRIKRGTGGSWANAVASIAHIPRFKLTMSGTPMPNGISDLIPQFRFLYPAVRADDANFLSRVRQASVRTTKAELGIKPALPQVVEIPMTDDQAKLYSLLANKTARQLEQSLSSSDRAGLRKAAASYQILLQAVTNPALLASKLDSYDLPVISAALASDSPKFAYACEKARRLAAEGKKTLIWTHFVANVETLAFRLSDLGAAFIHGGVEARGFDADLYGQAMNDEWDTDWVQDDESREEIIHRFHNDPTCMVLVANPQACSEGISLHTVCHHAIYIDRNYQAATFLQSQDRIHRLGLPPDVDTTLEYLISPGTIDESVARRLGEKIALMMDVLNDPSIQPPATTTPFEEMEQDMKDLLRLLRGNRQPLRSS